MINTLIYPMETSQNSAGHLVVDGCDVVDLATHLGTPLVIYHEKSIRDICQRYVNALAAHTDDFEVIYASKAFFSLAISELVLEEGLSIDVCSGGEYHVAKMAGFSAGRIFFHGNSKTRSELEYALLGGVGFVVVDNFQELDLLEELLASSDKRQKILLRIAPGVEAHTHSFIQTGQVDSKFGFTMASGVALEAIKHALQAPHLDLVGLHAHIGSQIFDLEGYSKAIETFAELMAKAHRDLAFECRYLNLGGGLGVSYTQEDTPTAIEEYAAVLVGGVREEMAAHGLSMPRILIEPGRSLVANAGMTAYTVGTIKEIPGIRTYVSVDGGMSDNIRPMMYEARYEAILANKVGQPADTLVTVAGKHCESGDILIKDVAIASPEPGDILVIPSTGAYCYSMSSNYNGNLRPAVAMINGKRARIIIERESYSDLVSRFRSIRD